MKVGWLLLSSMIAVGACTADGGDTDTATGEEEPARESPARPPGASNGEGMYVLETINGGGLPGIVEQDASCRVEVVEGSLRLEAGRFAFQNSTREVCGTTQPEPVIHAAGGSYTIDGNSIVLMTDVGNAFAEARGSIDSTVITLSELSTDAGAEAVTWRFQRDDSQLSPLPGSREGDDAADMSSTPGVTGGG